MQTFMDFEQMKAHVGCRCNWYSFTDCILYCENTYIYILQDHKQGAQIEDKSALKRYGKKYSWLIAQKSEIDPQKIELLSPQLIGEL